MWRWRSIAGLLPALAAVLVWCEGEASAGCESVVSRSSVVPCALEASPAVRRDKALLDATRGRVVAARVFFPSNPVVSFSAAHRSASPLSAVNWYVTLAQEIEIGGQQGARADVARAEVEAQSRQSAVTEREVTAAALGAYFSALAAREELALASRAASAARAIADASLERAALGLAAAIDAEVAYAASLRAIQARGAAERRAASALVTLATLVGADPAKPPRADGELTPLSVSGEEPGKLAERALSMRREVGAARAEQEMNERRVSLLRRARIPNPTLSLFAQNDGFNERVLGAGIAVPIPMPNPVGRSNAGEIAEASALARRAQAEMELVKLRVRAEVVTAAHDMASRKRELDAFDTKRVARAAESIDALKVELTAGRLSIRDALLAQQALIDLLQAHVEARRALCLASVELARAAGLPFAGGAP